MGSEDIIEQAGAKSRADRFEPTYKSSKSASIPNHIGEEGGDNGN